MESKIARPVEEAGEEIHSVIVVPTGYTVELGQVVPIGS
jgi:hypothetical protein